MEGRQTVLLVTSVLTETGGEGAVSYMKNCSHISLTFTTMGDIILISGTIMVDNGIFCDKIKYFPLYCHVHWQHRSGHAR
jgi:hypothetical protein